MWNKIMMLVSLFSFTTNAEMLVMGTAEDIPPYVYHENGQWTGIDVEISREIAKRLGLNIQYKGYPWKRLRKMVTDGHVDGILGVGYSEGEPKSLSQELDLTSEAMYSSPLALFALKDNQVTLKTLDDLKGKTVGVIFGYVYGVDEFDTASEIVKVPFYADETLVKRLNAGRILLGAAEEKPFLFYSKQLGFQNNFEKVFTLTEWQIYMGFSKQALGEVRSKRLADDFSRVIIQLRKEGVIQDILNKYH